MLKNLHKPSIFFIAIIMFIIILTACKNKPKYVDVFEVRKQALEDGGKYIDDTPYFTKDADGYIINTHIYSVDAETLRMLTDPDVHVEGDGFVRWKDWTVPKQYNFKNQLTGIVPVAKLKDPIFMSMNLPSEIPTYMKRINPYIISTSDSKFKKLRTIGAIYKNVDAEIPDDAEITICLGRTTLLLRTTESDGWYIAEERAYPTTPISIFYLPWALKDTLGYIKLSDDRIDVFDDHIEVKLTGSDLNGSAGRDQGAEGSVLHFWGKDVNVKGDEVLGLVSSYTVWVKEPEYVGKLAATIGADWRDEKNNISQSFTGYNYKVTTKPSVVFGHSVGPESYDEIMDVKKVCELLQIEAPATANAAAKK